MITDDQRRILEGIISNTYIANIPPFRLERQWALDEMIVEATWESDGAVLTATIYEDGAVWWWLFPGHRQSSQEKKIPQLAENSKYFRVPPTIMETLWKMGNAYQGDMARLSLEEHLEGIDNRVA